MLKICKINYYYVLFGILFLYLIWPFRFACFYFNYISPDDVFDTLSQKTTRNISTNREIKCEYNEVIQENLYFYKQPYLEEVINTYSIKNGGEYSPEECKTRYFFETGT